MQDQDPLADDWGREIAIREVVRLVHRLNQADAVDRFELRLRRLSREQLEWLRFMLDALVRDPDASAT